MRKNNIFDKRVKMKIQIQILLLFVGLVGCKSTFQSDLKYQIIDSKLQQEIEQMDAQFFQAYNTCDIEKQAAIYSDSIEFFHDKGGLMTSKKALLEGTKTNICGKVTRILIPNSIEVYPIQNYGAIEMGYHRFYNNQEPTAPSKPSKFIIVWKKEHEIWKITKVISLH